MIKELLILGFWSWSLIIAVPFLILMWLTNYDDYSDFSGSPIPAIFILGILVLITAFTNVNPFLYIWNNFGFIAIVALVYVFIGIGYMFVKWHFYTDKKLEFYNHISESIRQEYNNYIKETKVHNEKVNLFEENNDTRYSLYKEKTIIPFKDWVLKEYNLPPTAKNNKARLYIWIMYWPPSFVWSIIDHPLRKLFNNIYNMVGETLNKMSIKKFSQLEDFK